MKKPRRLNPNTYNIDMIYFADLAMFLIVIFFIMTAHEAKDVIEITAVNKVKKHIHNGAITVKFTGNGDLNFSYPQRNISVYDDRQASDYIQELLAHQVTDIVVLFASDDMAIKHTIAATVLFEKNGLDTVVWATL